MGMVAKFYQVSERQLSQFIRRPSLAYDYTMSSFLDDPAAVKMAEEMLGQMRSQMAGFPPGALAQLEHAAALLQRKASARTLLLERLAHGGALVLAVNAGRSPSELRVNKPRP